MVDRLYTAELQLNKVNYFDTETSKKLTGQIGFELSVSLAVRAWIRSKHACYILYLFLTKLSSFLELCPVEKKNQN